ncbi:MAG: Verru_Chthon cassette protein D [Verrucomicrobiales bacterium]
MLTRYCSSGRRAKGRGGFTLVELLVVIAVIGMVVVLAVPTIEPMMKGSKLTAAADDLRFKLSGYRQRCVAENRPIEVRFLKFIDTAVPGGRNAYRAYVAGRFRQERKSSGDGAFVFEPIDNVVRLPEGVVISSIPEFSTVVHNDQVRHGTHELPVADQPNAEFASFAFRPDGSTDLPKRAGDIWFLTIMTERDDVAGAPSPDNFITLAIDAYNGSVRSYSR